MKTLDLFLAEDIFCKKQMHERLLALLWCEFKANVFYEFHSRQVQTKPPLSRLPVVGCEVKGIMLKEQSVEQSGLISKLSPKKLIKR
jgi:hypothetical protein